MTIPLIRRADSRPAWAIWMVIPFTLCGIVHYDCYLVECDGLRFALTEHQKRAQFITRRASRAKK